MGMKPQQPERVLAALEKSQENVRSLVEVLVSLNNIVAEQQEVIERLTQNVTVTDPKTEGAGVSGNEPPGLCRCGHTQWTHTLSGNVQGSCYYAVCACPEFTPRES